VLEQTAISDDLRKLATIYKEDQIEELKEYMNEQNETFLNAKNVSEFDHVHRYYRTVLNTATSISDYLKKLQDFLMKEDKNNHSESLPDSLESCLVMRVFFEKKLQEAGNREQSFKFKVAELMSNSIISL
jgi:hypothetical protein